MRKLTFNGFLESYLKTLSLSCSLNIKRLATEAEKENPRLREPLFLYCLFSDKMELLLKRTKNKSIHFEINKLASKYNKSQMLSMLEEENSELPVEYLKVYKSYKSVREQKAHEEYTKNLMYQKIKSLQKETGVSTYRIGKDLGYNSGNFNRFMKGDLSKMSLSKARETLVFVENYLR